MPFLRPIHITTKEPSIYILRSISNQTDLNALTIKLAEKFKESNKKVLIFDAMLGLKNMPYFNENQHKIPAVFQGDIPLNELIQTHNKMDIITGIAFTNWTSLGQTMQYKLKQDLKILSSNYDVVLINHSACIRSKILCDLGQNLWISSKENKTLIKTLTKAAQKPPIQLMISDKVTPQETIQLNLLIKTICPTAERIDFLK